MGKTPGCRLITEQCVDSIVKRVKNEVEKNQQRGGPYNSFGPRSPKNVPMDNLTSMIPTPQSKSWASVSKRANARTGIRSSARSSARSRSNGTSSTSRSNNTSSNSLLSNNFARSNSPGRKLGAKASRSYRSKGAIVRNTLRSFSPSKMLRSMGQGVARTLRSISPSRSTFTTAAKRTKAASNSVRSSVRSSVNKTAKQLNAAKKLFIENRRLALIKANQKAIKNATFNQVMTIDRARTKANATRTKALKSLNQTWKTTAAAKRSNNTSNSKRSLTNGRALIGPNRSTTRRRSA